MMAFGLLAMLSIGGAAANSRESLDETIRRGMALAEQGDAELIDEHFRGAMRRFPNKALLYYSWARALFDSIEYMDENAIVEASDAQIERGRRVDRLLAQAIFEAPDYYDAYVFRARAHFTIHSYNAFGAPTIPPEVSYRWLDAAATLRPARREAYDAGLEISGRHLIFEAMQMRHSKGLAFHWRYCGHPSRAYSQDIRYRVHRQSLDAAALEVIFNYERLKELQANINTVDHVVYAALAYHHQLRDSDAHSVLDSADESIEPGILVGSRPEELIAAVREFIRGDRRDWVSGVDPLLDCARRRN